MHLSRRNVLAACAGAAAYSALPRFGSAWAGAPSKPKNLILVLATGGWDPAYVLDPKPGVSTIDVPAGTTRNFGDLPIFVDSSRPNVTAFFEAYGALTAVVNGVQLQSFVHPDCWKRILTGTASDANPDAGAITAYELGRDLPVPYLVLGHTAFTGPLASIAARAGSTNQVLALLDSKSAYPHQGQAFVPTDRETELMTAFLKARADRERAVRGAEASNKKRIDDFVESLDRGDRLKTFASGFGKRGIAAIFGQQAELAVNALEGGLCRAVHTELGGWDTHPDNSMQTGLHESLFGTLSTLAAALTKRKLIDDTVVAVVSEMGRTPKLNATKGKDHWPVTTALVFGGGVKGGKAYGGSSDKLEALSCDFATGAVDPNGKQIQFGNLVAGILSLAGVDSTAYLPKSEPFRAFAA